MPQNPSARLKPGLSEPPKMPSNPGDDLSGLFPLGHVANAAQQVECPNAARDAKRMQVWNARCGQAQVRQFAGSSLERTVR